MNLMLGRLAGVCRKGHGEEEKQWFFGTFWLLGFKLKQTNDSDQGLTVKIGWL